MRRWLLRLHRWTGLLIAAVVMVVGLTGAVTAYQAEIDAWLNADLLRVEIRPDSRALPLDAVIAAAESAWPGLRASSVRLPQAAGESVEVSVVPPGAQDFSGRYVYLDGASGDVLGSRPFDPDPWSRRGAVASLYEVHYSLAASRPGVWLVSLVAAVWLATTLLGLWLAWPRSKSDLARVWRVRTAVGAAAWLHDLHRLTGLLIAPVIVTVLATGIALNLSPQATALLQRFLPLTSEPSLLPAARESLPTVIGWQAALTAARAVLPAAQPYSIQVDPERGVYLARLREPDAIHRRGQAHVFVDARDGRVLAARSPRAGSAGDRVWAWQNPLHSGHAFGVPGRMLVFLSGIAAVLFVMTGVTLWLARRPPRKR